MQRLPRLDVPQQDDRLGPEVLDGGDHRLEIAVRVAEEHELGLRRLVLGLHLEDR